MLVTRNAACNELPCVWAAHPCRPCSGTTSIRVGFRAGTTCNLIRRHRFVKCRYEIYCRLIEHLPPSEMAHIGHKGGLMLQHGADLPRHVPRWAAIHRTTGELPQQNMREYAWSALTNRANGHVDYKKWIVSSVGLRRARSSCPSCRVAWDACEGQDGWASSSRAAGFAVLATLRRQP